MGAPVRQSAAEGEGLEVVSDTLGHASIRVTMDVYGYLLAPSRMEAVEAMHRALWVDDLPASTHWLQNELQIETSKASPVG